MDHNGLSFGVIKAVHCLDVTQHVQASSENDHQQQCCKQADPYWHCEEANTIPGLAKGGIVAGGKIKESFHLKETRKI